MAGNVADALADAVNRNSKPANGNGNGGNEEAKRVLAKAEQFIVAMCKLRFDSPRQYVRKDGTPGSSQIVPCRDLAAGLQAISPSFADAEKRKTLYDHVVRKGLVVRAWCGSPALADKRYTGGGGGMNAETAAVLKSLGL